MNILITGGAGFIGSSLAKKLVKEGAQVTVLDILSSQVHGSDPTMSTLAMSLPESSKFIQGDIRNRELLESLLNGQDVVVHFAAETGTGQSMYEIDKYVDVNIGGTSLLLDILEKKRFPIKRLIVASSRSIYGEGRYKGSQGFVYPEARLCADMQMGVFECRCPQTGEFVEVVATDENSKIHPTSIYGITKQVQEQLVLTACDAIGIEAVALRYQNVYGPGQSLKNPYTGILSIFSTLLLQDQDVNIFEDGQESRDFVYIDDVVEATFKAIYAQSIHGAYNVGSGKQTTVLDVATTLKDIYHSNSNIKITGNFRIGDIRHNIADIGKIKKDLNFEPNVQFKEGAKLFADWVKLQPIEISTYDQSLKEMREKGMFK